MYKHVFGVFFFLVYEVHPLPIPEFGSLSAFSSLKITVFMILIFIEGEFETSQGLVASLVFITYPVLPERGPFSAAYRSLRQWNLKCGPRPSV